MHKKNFFQRMKMPLPELEEYYRRCREEAFWGNMPIRGMKIRKLIHPLLLLAVRVRRLIARETLHVVNDRHTDTGESPIYAATHIGWSDVEMIYSAIKSHAYIFWGDPHELYRKIEGFFLGLNGAICCDTSSKSDRHIGKETCIRLLNQGGSLLIYPEGAWNITENRVVMPLYTGAVELAIRTGAQIVPIAIEEYEKRYYVNIGGNMNFADYSLDQKQEATDLLRDMLCSLKWEILEKYGKCSRKDIPEGYSDIFCQNLMYRWVRSIPWRIYIKHAIAIRA